ncbi:MAG: right-handed parallel beta-helix repeat-containing protein [Acidobacteria bacterium]|nr:right-handed parallel beta-helix repeat-containing protein [Acidobacteriota bacterium]
MPSATGGVVHVASPTGKKATDRASIQAALEQVEPGGTIQFAPGTYLIGAGIRIQVARLTLRGHPQGTTLRGCDPDEFATYGLPELSENCEGLRLLAGHQSVHDLTFEYAFTGLYLGLQWETGDHRAHRTEGGDRIMNNTFRTGKGIVLHGDWPEPSVIRNNRFINNYHAVNIFGATAHVLDNHFSVPEPERVPIAGFPDEAVRIFPRDREAGDTLPTVCGRNVVAGNRIEGALIGIEIRVREADTSCEGNVIRNNWIAVTPARVPEWSSVPAPDDSRIVYGLALALNDLAAEGSGAESDAAAPRISGNVIEGNRIIGGSGPAIQLYGAAGNRIVDNTITGVRLRETYPGHTLYLPPPGTDANGSGIWISHGSDDNEIVGNTFEDVASYAIVIEGDRNRVVTASASDSVRDLGRGNRVTGSSATPAAAEPAHPEWRPVASPDGARVFALAYADGTLFASTRAGLFASEDLGTSWQLRGPASRLISRVLPTAEGALLVGTYRQGILRSDDGGRTWSPVGFERNIYTQGLVQDADGRIYAAVRRAVEDEPTGVFRSSDDGRTWVAAGLGAEEVYSLSLPRPGLLFAGTRRGLFRSEDGGATWSRMASLPSEAPVLKVVAAGGHLYAAMGSRLSRTPGGGVARSADGGRSWQPTEGLPPGTSVQDLVVRDGVVFAATGNVVHGGGRGAFRLDEGGSWQPARLQDVWLLSLLETPDGLFAGAYELGVFHSADGRTWNHRSAGLRNWEPTSLLFDDKGLLYALSVRSLFRSTDRGRSWVETPRPEGSAPPNPWSLAADSRGDLYLAGEGGVLVSSDQGQSWEIRPIPGEDGQVFAVTMGCRSRLYAVVRGKAAYTSADGGRTWEVVDLPAPPRMALFASPAGARFLTAPDGTWRWSEGESWRAVNEAQVGHLTACGDALIAGTFARGLLRSTDDGRTWTPITEDLRAEAQQAGYITFTSIACLPAGGILAGTFWDGVFYSPDGGATWVDVSAGLPSPSSQDFATTPDGQVFVATPAGVYQADFTGAPQRGDGSVPTETDRLQPDVQEGGGHQAVGEDG